MVEHLPGNEFGVSGVLVPSEVAVDPDDVGVDVSLVGVGIGVDHHGDGSRRIQGLGMSNDFLQTNYE